MAEQQKTDSRPKKWLRVLIPSVLIIIWVALAGIGGPYFGRIEEVSEVDLTAFLPKNSEATRVQNELKNFRTEGLLPAFTVFEASDGELSTEDSAAIEASTQRFANINGIKGEISPPIISEDNKAAFVTTNIDSDAELKEVVTEMRQHLKDDGLENVNYYVSGPAGFSRDLNVAFAGIDGLLLLVALAVVFVILVIVYRSPLLPIIVLMTSVFALAASILIVFLLAKQGLVELNGQVQGILFILVIGAATDYSLLYVSRYREELLKHPTTWQANLLALKGSFEPILASGGTVIVGLLCLLFSDLASNKALGPVGSIGIAMAVLSALTFLPALLQLFGRVSFWPFRPRYNPADAKDLNVQKGLWKWVGEKVRSHPRPIWITTALVLAIAAIGVTQLKADGVAQSDLIIGYSEAREGQNALNRHFPDGSGSPALVIANASDQEELVEVIEGVEGVVSVSATADNSPSDLKPLGKEADKIIDEIRAEIQKEVDAQLTELDEQASTIEAQAGPQAAAAFREQVAAQIPDVETLTAEANPFNDATVKVVNDRILLNVVLDNPPDSLAAEQTVKSLREAVHASVVNANVGGVTATALDTNTTSIRDRAIIIPIVLVAITIILMILLRSIVAPILLLLTTVVSFGTALGVAALLFNNLLGLPGADPSVILYAFVFLVALGIDYNIFLMTRVREESLKHGTRDGVIRGLVVTGGVITSAGIVLAATFAALSVIPILFLGQLAFIVAFGVLLDTIVVRSLLVPALIHDIGAKVWWPSKLAKKD